MSRRFGICFVAPWAYGALARDRTVPFIGGAEVQQSFLAPELARRGHAVSMVTMDFGQGPEVEAQGVRVLRTHAPEAGLPGLRFVHPRLTATWAALKAADADVYYQRSLGALTGIVAAFARRYGRKFVFAAASDLDLDPEVGKISGWRDRALSRYGIRQADAIIVQTDKQRALCAQGLRRDSTVVNSCFRSHGRAAQPDGPILWVGTVKDIKRPEILLELAERLPQRRFVMVGGSYFGDPLFDRIAERARQLGNVECVGHVHFADVEQWFDGGAVLVNTSRSEGFPNTFLQAWARGMPTVSYFDPGTRLDGLAVNRVVADLEELTDSVEGLLTESAEWSRCSELVRRCFERRHGVDVAAGLYEQVIESLFSGSQWVPEPSGRAP